LSHIVFGTAENMVAVKSGRARLTVLSPPHIPHHSKRGKEIEILLLFRLFSECARVTAPDGVVVSYNTDLRDRGQIYLRHIAVVQAAAECGLVPVEEKIRVRTYGRDLFRKGFSFVLVFRKDGSRVGHNGHIPEYEKDVWYLPKSQRVGEFRDAMPPEVPCILIKNFTRPGDLLVSACAGSGTVVIAALRMGRRAIGYEIDPTRQAVIEERERRFGGYFSDQKIVQWLRPT
jgi:hypothetical protein